MRNLAEEIRKYTSTKDKNLAIYIRFKIHTILKLKMYKIIKTKTPYDKRNVFLKPAIAISACINPINHHVKS